MPVKRRLDFLAVFGCVAHADADDVAQVLGRKLKPVNVSPKKNKNGSGGLWFVQYPFSFSGSQGSWIQSISAEFNRMQTDERLASGVSGVSFEYLPHKTPLLRRVLHEELL